MKKVLITAGAGFIASQTADLLMEQGIAVRVLDNLSSGHRENLPAQHKLLEFVKGDICDAAAVRDAMQGVSHCLHLAAQVSVVASLEDPEFSAKGYGQHHGKQYDDRNYNLLQVDSRGGTLSTSNTLRLTIRITDLDLVNGENVILRIKYGGTTLASVTITNGTCATISNSKLRLVGMVNGDAATNAQLGDLWVAASDSTLTITNGYGAGTAAIDSTSTQTLLVTSDFSSAAANSITLGYAILETLS